MENPGLLPLPAGLEQVKPPGRLNKVELIKILWNIAEVSFNSLLESLQILDQLPGLAPVQTQHGNISDINYAVVVQVFTYPASTAGLIPVQTD